MSYKLLLIYFFSPLFLYAQINIAKEFTEIINTELAFSKLSETKGIREAFLTYLDDKAIVFRPIPKNGKDLYKSRKEILGNLIWKPEYADISSSGDFGYTTGPWEFSLDSTKEYGHFVTVWHKIDSNNWRALIDIGISHNPINIENVSLPALLESGKKQTNYDSIRSSKEILNLDKSLSYSNNKPEGNRKYLNLLSKKIRFNLPEKFPITSLDTVKNYINTNQESMISKPENSVVSNKGDMGYTYGITEITKNANKQRFSYLRIWERENYKWSLVLEVRNLVK